MSIYYHVPLDFELKDKTLFVGLVLTCEEFAKLQNITKGESIPLRHQLCIRKGDNCIIYKINEERFNLQRSDVDFKYGLYSEEYDYVSDIDDMPNGAIDFFICKSIKCPTARLLLNNKNLYGPIMILGIVTNYEQSELERIYLQLYNELNSDGARKKFMKNIAPELINKFELI